ncbi:MAG: hypothetical protein V4513_08015 [Pseudomonadota bacterium]
MNTSGIFITSEHLKSLPKTQQDFLFGILTGAEAAHTATTQPASSAAEVDDLHFVELSPAQAREFYAGCGEKTKKAIDAMVSGSSPKFQVADVAKALGVNAPELRGVWGGLTRRAQTITGDDEAYLVDWSTSEAVYDENGKYADQAGWLTELTYNSFRKALAR